MATNVITTPTGRGRILSPSFRDIAPSTVGEIRQQGEELGYQGADLDKYVRSTFKQMQDQERTERLAQRERDHKERLAERESQARLVEKELELTRLKMEMFKTGQSTSESKTSPFSIKIKAPPDFVQGDDMDVYIRRFEIFANNCQWSQDVWGVAFSGQLSGKALAIYNALDVEQTKDWASVKCAMLKAYNLTEEGYREKFRQSRPAKFETATQFVVRLKHYLARWVELSGIENTAEALIDLIAQEQYLSTCSYEVVMHVREHACNTVGEMATCVDRRDESRHYTGMNHKTPRVEKTSKNTSQLPSRAQGLEATGGQQSKCKPVCHRCGKLGHMKTKCWSTRDAKGNILTVGACMNTRSVLNASSDKSTVANRASTSVLITEGKQMQMTKIGDKVLPVPAMMGIGISEVAETISMPIAVGTVNGHKVSVLRDTGCSGVTVRTSLVHPSQMSDEEGTCILIDGSRIRTGIAELEVQTPYYTGPVRALCFKSPIWDLVIGNIEGAREPFNPDLGQDGGRSNMVNNRYLYRGTPCNETVSELQRHNKAGRQFHAPIRPGVQEKSNSIDAVQGVVTRSQFWGGDKLKAPLKVLTRPNNTLVTTEELKAAQKRDPTLKRARELATKGVEINTGTSNICRFLFKKGLLYRHFHSPSLEFGRTFKQLVVPSAFRLEVMKLGHDSILAGHLGTQKTINKIFTQFYWPAMHEQIKRYCRSCDICQRTIPKGKIGKVPLGTMPLIDVPFKRVAMDLVGPIKPATTKGHQYILTVVDYATRYPEATPLKRISTEVVAEALFTIYCRVGFPEQVLTDQGTQFVSDVMREVSRLLSIKQLTTTPYHPQCNGLVERFNATLKGMLKRMCSERPKDWDRYIAPLLFAYREAPQASLGFSPFELLYGRTVRGPMTILRELWTGEATSPEVLNTYEYVLNLRNRLETTCQIAQQELTKSSERYRSHFDKKTKPRKFEVGDQVLLLLPTSADKLRMQWQGPYKIKERVGQVDYRIDKNGKLKLYHINMLKKYEERSFDNCEKDSITRSEVGTAGLLTCVSTGMVVTPPDDQRGWS
ncbi:uncharacterized protein LOC100374860 [Saccoglossus kowalevskii]|uniref:Uncharacterized protein LOC100374860 n=1 Tax=Saccoglossus kowalevskii TaxID=10224 RepID=A0ABM0LY45_SACKO|nr:PREDICTED: uncharacterized protein LOC100374860 [Saccoglossus kowalevskii]